MDPGTGWILQDFSVLMYENWTTVRVTFLSKIWKMGLSQRIWCFFKGLKFYNCTDTSYIQIKSKVVRSFHFFVVIKEWSSYVKWLVLLPSTPGDFSFSTSILITLMKMTKFTWTRESEQETLQNFGVHHKY